MTARTPQYIKARLKDNQPDVLDATTALARITRDLIDSLGQLTTSVDNYKFPAEFPKVVAGSSINAGRQLFAGLPATVRFDNVPAGVYGSNVAYYLYISDGASSEAVLVTGGTSSSTNTVNATITFTPANNHTGAQWSIISAYAGVAEAEIVNPGALLQAGSETLSWYAPWTPTVFAAGLIGTTFTKTVVSLLYAAQFASSSAIILGLGQVFAAKNLWFVPDTNLTGGAVINQTVAGNLLMSNVYFGANGSVNGVYKGFIGKGVVFADHLTIIATFAGFDITAAYFELDGIHILSNKSFATKITNSYSWYISGVAGGFANKVIHDAGYFDFGPTLDSTGTICNELFLTDCYDDHWGVAGFRTVGAAGSQVAFINIVNMRLVDDATADATGAIATALLLTSAANIFNIANIQISYSYGRAINISAGQNINFSNGSIEARDPLGGVCAVNIDNTAGSKNISFENFQVGIGANTPAIGYSIDSVVDYLSITGGFVKASSQANKMTIVNGQTNSNISAVAGIGTAAKSVVAAAALAFPTMENVDALEITGAAAITSVTALRAGMRGTLISTNATPGQWTNGNNIASPNFTPVQKMPYPFYYNGTSIYVGYGAFA